MSDLEVAVGAFAVLSAAYHNIILLQNQKNVRAEEDGGS